MILQQYPLSDNIIKFIGGDGITTGTDQDGNLTLNLLIPEFFRVTGEATALNSMVQVQ